MPRRPRSPSLALLRLLPALLLACAGDDGGDDGSTGSTSSTGAGSTTTGAAATTTASDSTTASATTAAETTTTAGGETETDTDADTDTDTGGELDDEALLRLAIDGALDPAEALALVADRGGLPVLTQEGTFLFACLCGPGEWSLIGDHNAWAGEAMARTGELSWIEASIPAPDGSRYKFKRPPDPDRADPYGRRYAYDDNGEISLVRASAAHLERWYGVGGYGLPPRDLQVWVPEGGAFTHALFAHDGQNLFDPAAFFGGWKLDQSAPPEMLIVGINNAGAGRFEEYTHVEDVAFGEVRGGDADAYADLVELQIRPKMEAAYGEAAVVGTMGSSLGGLVSLLIADRFPARYDMAISLSGTLGWGSRELQNETVIDLYAGAGKRPYAIYLDSGAGDGGAPCVDSDDDGVMDDNLLAKDNYCENIQMRDLLAALGHEFGVDLWHWHEPGAPHNEAAWAARVDLPLGLFAGL